MTAEEQIIYDGMGKFRGVDFHKLRCFCFEWEPENSKAFHSRYCPWCGVPLASTLRKWDSHSIRERKRAGSWGDER